MRNFAKPGGIERLSLEARVVYTFFCLFLLAGYVSSVWFWLDDELGATPSAAQRYYLGGTPSETQAAAEASGDGPALELPDEAVAEPIRLAKPPRQVMETFHFHLFSVSVCLLIVAHLFMMCGLSSRLKAAVIAVASIVTFLHLLVPPLIRFASPSFAVLMFPSVVLMTVTWVWMTVQPIWEMWTRLPRRREPEEPASAG